MTTIKTSEIRQSFLDYFKSHDHRLVPSSPVIPYNDPTLLFINAGMNQFKDVFTGRRKVDFKRATSAQKCIRAGGKHNDLDNVGFTARHHTFFEMLGNFSFGDYFKEEAILFCWEWVTRDMAMPKDRLYATVYDDDDEAFRLWEKIAPELRNGRIRRFGKKDNYWSMGDVGPCGPCSELHIDRGERFGTGPQDILNGETDRFMEIWNLVFMQFDQLPDGSVVPLPKPSVDTGAGLERIAAVIQQADSNYGIDIFRHIIESLCDIAHSDYKTNVCSHQVIADHIRALTFAIADGAGISNEGQGYVLRRILRRASRHGRLLGVEEPFIYRLVSVVSDEMGDAYPEIREKRAHIERIIRAEEESFGRTLETGLELFEKIVKGTSGKVVAGEDVFRLYDTYGFPYDLTEIMAAEKGMTLDRDGFDKAMQRQQEQSKAAGNFESRTWAVASILDKTGFSERGTDFVRGQMKTESKVLHFLRAGWGAEVSLSGVSRVDDQVTFSLIVDRTPFYAESGGQQSDTGTIASSSGKLKVGIVQKHRDWYIHEGVLVQGDEKSFPTGATVTAEVDAERRWDIMRNHTATHLTQAALRKVLGTHIKQSGSYVGPDRLRFDFSHHQPLTEGEIRKVEEIVNGEILRGTPVNTEIMDVDAAKATGAMALFGEKYEEKVRVVSVGGFSKELCGGTHVDDVNRIGPFFITLETGIASGVRRLEAITGRAAIQYMLESKRFREDAVRIIGQPDDPIAGLEALREQNLALQKELKKTKAEMFTGGGKAVGDEKKVGRITLVTHFFGEADRDVMGGWIDSQKNRRDAAMAVALGHIDGKLTYMAAASSAAVSDLDLDIGKMSRDLLSKFGGRGGGKRDFAQGTVATGTVYQDLFKRAQEELISWEKSK